MCRNFFLLFLLAGLNGPGLSQRLVAQLSNAKLPTPRTSVAAVYDEDDSIFIFGGYNGPTFTDILKYSIATDSIEPVGNLPVSVDSGVTAKGQDGTLYHIGGYGSDSIYSFSPGDGGIDLVAQLPSRHFLLASVQFDASTSYIFGAGESGRDIIKFDTSQNEVEIVGQLPVPDDYTIFRASGASLEDSSTILVFGSFGNPTNWKFVVRYNPSSGNAEIVGPSPTFPTFYAPYNLAGVGPEAYIMANYYSSEGNLDDIVSEMMIHSSNSLTSIECENYPANSSIQFFGTKPIYVSKLHRLYLFGGTLGDNRASTQVRTDSIWMINLDGTAPTTTTGLTTTSTTTTPGTTDPTATTPTPTTTPPIQTTTPDPDEVFDCTGRPEGMYPHPLDCAMFIGCRNGQSQFYRCPPPLLFDPILQTCNTPSESSCEIHCNNKPDGIHPHPYECNYFMICNDGELGVYRCPYPLLFDKVELKCTFPEDATC